MMGNGVLLNLDHLCAEQDAGVWMQRALDVVEQALDAWVPADAPSGLGEAMRYGVLDGGKRLRPLLVLASAHAASGCPKAALRAAVAVELVHAYSLIHDDMPCMDNDVLRRGKPTVHVKFGEAVAMLAGDAMQALAFDVLTPDDGSVPEILQARLCRNLARSAGHRGMAGGQAIDLDVPVLERVQVLGMAEAYLKAEYRQQQARLVSPSDGVIYRIHAHPGDMLREGDPLLAIVPTGSRFVEALVLETDLSRIDLDRPVRVLPASGHGVELRGWVRRIMPSAASVFSPLPRNNIDSNWVKVTQRVPVMIALEARGDAGLLPLGTSARVEFPVRREPGALRVTAVDKAEKRGRAPEMRYRAPALDVAPLLDALATRYAHTRIGACRLR